ncbi:39S ribosomal protein L48, mitochondrial [Lynx rufus]|uniref:39S ribosomal protein L48, mitochondrial n=1 Tax=Lynx rufus TaxID=61384 RepID=UPI001F12603D|nr:39S ribosomal protein L48, mitochondrial [Lynx rufus]
MMKPKELPPPQLRDLSDRRCTNRLTKKVRGRTGAELSWTLQGPAAEQDWRAGLLPTDRQPSPPPPRRVALAPRGPRLGKEGWRCRKQPRLPQLPPPQPNLLSARASGAARGEPGRERAAPPAVGVRACACATSQRLPGLACSPGFSFTAETRAGEVFPSVFPDAGRSLQLGRVFSLHNYRPQQQRMNGTLGKVLCPRNDTIFKQVFSLLRFRTSGENPICSAGGILLSTSRHYKTKPTHGIGRYKHLVKAQEPKKKRGKVEVRPINLGTDYEYGVLNIHLTAYDMAVAESYAQYVHNLCNHLSIKVEESYAMPTKTMEVLRLQDQGSKMFLDSVLTTHERVVQISGLSATFAEIFLEIIQSNLPEGVRLSVKEHTEEDFKGRFKARPELEELLAKLN